MVSGAIFGILRELAKEQPASGAARQQQAVPTDLPAAIREDIARRPIPPGVHRVYNKAFKMPERLVRDAD